MKYLTLAALSALLLACVTPEQQAAEDAQQARIKAYAMEKCPDANVNCVLGLKIPDSVMNGS